MSPEVSKRVPAARFAALSLSRALVVSFVVLNVVLIVLRRDLSVREDGISSYLVGDFRWLGLLSFVLLSAGGALLAGAVRFSREPRRTVLSLLLLIYSLGVLLAGLTHPGSAGHSLGAGVAFAAIPVAVLVSSARFRIVWFVAIVASFATWPVLHFGLGERLTVFLELAWLLWLGSKRAGRGRFHPLWRMPTSAG